MTDDSVKAKAIAASYDENSKTCNVFRPMANPVRMDPLFCETEETEELKTIAYGCLPFGAPGRFSSVPT